MESKERIKYLIRTKAKQQEIPSFKKKKKNLECSSRYNAMSCQVDQPTVVFFLVTIYIVHKIPNIKILFVGFSFN